MVSQQLCQYVKTIVGVDISQVSVDRYNTQAANQGLAPDEMRAICSELKGDPGELDGTVDRYVDLLALGAPGALAATKAMLRRTPPEDMGADLDAMLALSAEFFASDEGQEGMAAFAEKRKANFTHS